MDALYLNDSIRLIVAATRCGVSNQSVVEVDQISKVSGTTQSTLFAFIYLIIYTQEVTSIQNNAGNGPQGKYLARRIEGS